MSRSPARCAVPPAALACVIVSSACGPTNLPAAPQLLIYIDTDAIVPRNQLAPVSDMDALPLFDTILIDGIHDGAVCATCTHEFSIFEQAFQNNGVSFGVVAPLVAGDSVRVRLFLSSYATSGEPPPEATIDVTAVLPALPPDGTLEQTLFLPTDAVGNPTTGSLTPGASPSRVGTWAGAKRVDCSAPPHPGEVCVPGGAYWMGNPLVAHLGDDDGDHLRLVVLSPFYMDSTEVTVSAYRALADTIGLGEEWSGQIGCDPEDYCTFTASKGDYDQFPMNCVNWEQGSTYCQMIGKELPTEAQYEYAASGLASHTFVWGEDAPTCSDAILERGGLGYFVGYDGECRADNPTDKSCQGAPKGGLPIGGPEAVKSGAIDWLTIRLPSSTGTVYDLVGNVSELSRDSWNLLTSPCWSRPGVYTDPVCTTTSGSYSTRGGDWTALGADSRAAVRHMIMTPTDFSAQLGFRCVRPVK
jgi:sulfatase modifying factor 1